MILTINKNEYRYENKIESVSLIMEDISSNLEESNKLLDYMIVDGVEVYLDYKEYIKKNIEYIENIDVKIIKKKELVENILMTAMKYIENAIPIVERLADEFYKSPLTDDWNKLEELFEAIAWIVESFYYIDNDEKLNLSIDNKEAWNIYAKEIYELVELLPEIESSIINQDNILIGDLLSYEIVPIFEDMEKNIIEIIRVDEQC